MKIVMVSNYMTHHQRPFCQQLRDACGGDFWFVADTPTEQERKDMGFEDMNAKLDYILRIYEGPEQKKKALELIQDADVVILGNAELSYVKKRLNQKKLTFRYAERIYKRGYQAWKYPIRVVKHYFQYGRHKNFYLLCASAYAAGDFAKTGMFINRAYKWGYFPELKQYDDVDGLIARKEPDSLLWAGRFIDWKHPDQAIRLAARLKQAGYTFKLRMIGMGVMDDQLRQQAQEQNVEDCVEFMGAMFPDQVREHMEKTQIYLFTSDRNEGWGAVLNESMNSCCAVVASSSVGAAPFLLQSGENGYTYTNSNEDELFEKVRYLLEHRDECSRIGQKAYETMSGLWNAQTAAKRLLKLFEDLLAGRQPETYAEGPCGIAEVLPE